MALGDLTVPRKGLGIDWAKVERRLADAGRGDPAAHGGRRTGWSPACRAATSSGSCSSGRSARPSTLVVAAYPSRGLDIATTRRTQELLLERRAAGAGVLLISEDLDELLELSDRIVVLHDGRGRRHRRARARPTATQIGGLMLRGGAA